MDPDRKKRLIELGPEALADALLESAVRFDAVDDLIEHLIATPMENMKHYKSKLAGLKRRRRFISWHESAAYAQELEMLLEDLRSGVKDPRTGVELVAAFYQADAAVFEQCDDSSGSVGNVFRFEAQKLFVAYASKCQDKDWLSQMVFDLTIKDDYGVRDILIDCAGEYLPESKMRELIVRCQAAAGKESGNYRKRQWLSRVESLARQIKDAPLFEKTRLVSWGKLNSAACLDIARVHLDSGDAKTALSWLQRVPEEEIFRAHEKDQLLLEIYAELGDKDNQTEVAWRTFRRHRSEKTLDDLLSVIGHDQKAEVVETETYMQVCFRWPKRWRRRVGGCAHPLSTGRYWIRFYDGVEPKLTPMGCAISRSSTGFPNRFPIGAASKTTGPTSKICAGSTAARAASGADMKRDWWWIGQSLQQFRK